MTLWGVGLLVGTALLLFQAPPREAAALAGALKTPALPPGTAEAELRAFLDRRTPELQPPARAAEWTRTAARTRERLLAEVVFRGVPAAWTAGEPRVEWGGRIATPGGYRIRKLRYQAVPGLWIPALLYEPNGLRERVPGILNVNGHVGAPGKAIEYEQIRCINLAKRGMLALHPEWLNCGELAHPEFAHNRLAYLDLCGRSGLAVMYLAMRRGLDVLAAHANAYPRRLAMTGLSGGGWQTIWLSALDPRIAATAPNAGYIGLRERARNRSDIGDLEQNPADMLRHADYPGLTALLATRPALLLYNEQDDCCFRTPRARPSVYEPVRPFYALSGHADQFRFHNNIDPGTHNYERDNREQFYRFLNDVFRPAGARRDEELPAAGEVLSFDALRGGVPPPAGPGEAREGRNAGFGALAEELLPALPRSRWPEGDRAAAERWQTAGRRELQALLRVPTLPAATVASESKAESPGAGDTLRRLTLRLGEAWTLPAVEIRPQRGSGVAIVAADRGRTAAGERVERLLAGGRRVVVIDLAASGECLPAGPTRGQVAMMMGATGERLLGVQAAQLLSAARWAAREAGADRVTLAGVGRGASLAAAVAAALAGEQVEELVVEAVPASLKLLVEERVEYNDCPELFAFGLLERFDVREILALSGATTITLRGTRGSRERIGAELGRLIRFQERLGRRVVTIE